MQKTNKYKRAESPPIYVSYSQNSLDIGDHVANVVIESTLNKVHEVLLKPRIKQFTNDMARKIMFRSASTQMQQHYCSTDTIVAYD